MNRTGFLSNYSTDVIKSTLVKASVTKAPIKCRSKLRFVFKSCLFNFLNPVKVIVCGIFSSSSESKFFWERIEGMAFNEAIPSCNSISLSDVSCWVLLSNILEQKRQTEDFFCLNEIHNYHIMQESHREGRCYVIGYLNYEMLSKTITYLKW